MSGVWIAVCGSDELLDGEQGVRFEWTRDDGLPPEPAFVIRYAGTAHAYLNRCGHVPIELDWLEGSFFDTQATYLVCATHGALYAPESGHCMAGPCAGRGLVRLPCREAEGRIWVSAPAVRA